MVSRKLRLIAPILLASIISFAQQEQTSYRNGKDYALFFAVNDYIELDTLHSPLKKATQIATVLQTKFGFNVEIVPNPTRDQIDNKLKEYKHFFKFSDGAKYAPDGQLLVFFLGHGNTIDDKGFFFPKDASKKKLNKTGIAYEELAVQIEEFNCQHILVAIDAFKGNRFTSASPAFMSFPQLDTLTAPERDLLFLNYQKGKTRSVLSLAASRYITPDSSRFAAHFYAALNVGAEKAKPLALRMLYANLVKADSMLYFAPFGSNQASGDFVFFPTNSFLYQQQELPEDVVLNPAIPDATPLTKEEMDSQMIFVSGSAFRMGDEFKLGEADESPLHMVQTNAFLMSEHEVTQKAYRTFCLARGIQRSFDPAKMDYPVDSISWYDAIEYCNWLSLQHGLLPVYSIDKRRKDPKNASLQDHFKWKVSLLANGNGYRLPTESEWEFAARSQGLHHIWAGSRLEKEVNRFANYSVEGAPIDTFRFAAPVGSFAPNALGLYDMSGNVAEWCWDWYDEKYYSKWENNNDQPTVHLGPRRGKFRVAKGGAWNDTLENLRISNRTPLTPDVRQDNLGFRLVRGNSHINQNGN
ncbi:MAG: SUMF1/EgtB/PvdO family nonheme iron enzyme [Saprospiraceae bacterium]